MGLFDWLKSLKKTTDKSAEGVRLGYRTVIAIRQQVTNLSENAKIVNTSDNYDEAVAAFDAACAALRFLSDFTDEEIRAAGCSLSKPAAPYLSYLLENKDALLDKVRSRIPSFSFDHYEISPSYSFVSASVRAMYAHGDTEKLRQLEEQLPGLVSFVRSSLACDGELPPYVPCRDSLPELYMRFGKWEKAEQVIRLCMSCGAYGYTDEKTGRWVSESGDAYLSTVRIRRLAADAALSFLSANPGTVQSKMYKIPALSQIDHDALVWFCRNSHQVRKEKDGKSNRLYVAEEFS